MLPTPYIVSPPIPLTYRASYSSSSSMGSHAASEGLGLPVGLRHMLEQHAEIGVGKKPRLRLQLVERVDEVQDHCGLTVKHER